MVRLSNMISLRRIRERFRVGRFGWVGLRRRVGLSRVRFRLGIGGFGWVGLRGRVGLNRVRLGLRIGGFGWVGLRGRVGLSRVRLGLRVIWVLGIGGSWVRIFRPSVGSRARVRIWARPMGVRTSGVVRRSVRSWAWSINRYLILMSFIGRRYFFFRSQWFVGEWFFLFSFFYFDRFIS